MDDEDAQPRPAADGRSTAASPDGAPHALGILLVHGIGDQKQGETLNEFGTPIVKWLDRWLEPDIDVQPYGIANLARHIDTKDVTGRAVLAHALLRPPDLALDTPAFAVARVSTKIANVESQQSWLMTESWWSPQTLTPRVSLFLLWLITRGPWIVLLHFAQCFAIPIHELGAELGARRSARTRSDAWIYWQVAKAVAATGLWLGVSLGLILAWGIVSLIALVPVGYVRARVYAVLQAITGVVGDSFVLINDPIQRAAFGATTRRALEWLQAQGCTRLVVVAHSQGAAVARDVLLAPGAPRVDRFVTLGPGIAKLDALDGRERDAPGDFLWCGAAAPLSAVAAVAFLRLLAADKTGFDLWGFPVVFGTIALGVVVFSWRSVGKALADLSESPVSAMRWLIHQRGMRWHDFWASRDPVSNGSLSAALALPRILSQRVRVLGSLLQDHTSYWLSRADFVAHLVRVLDRCAGTRLFSAAGRVRVRRGRRNFERCVALLVALRWTTRAALLVPVLKWRAVLEEGMALSEGLGQLEIESLDGLIGALKTAAGWLGAQTPAQEAMVAGTVLLVALAALVLHVWGRIVRYWWENMIAIGLVPVFRPSRAGLAAWGQAALGVLVVALGILPLVLMLLWTFLPAAVTLGQLDTLLATFAKGTVVTLYGVFVAAGVALVLEQWALLRQAWSTHHKVAAALRATPEWPVVPIYWAAVLAVGWAGVLRLFD